MSENYVLVFDKNAEKYPSLWWTGPSKKMNEVQAYSDNLFNFFPYILGYIILWMIAYYFKPKSVNHDLNTVLPPFLFGLVCLTTWVYYYATNKIVFYNAKTAKYYKYNIPHPRRIITEHNSKIDLGDNIGIISIKDFKKIEKSLDLKTENFPDYSRGKGEKLAEGKYNPAFGERYFAQRVAGYNISFTLFSFAYLLSQAQDKNILSSCFYWIALGAIVSFFPHTIGWLGIGPTDRYNIEKLLNINQFLTYLGASFGFLAAFIVYKHSMKKI